MLSLIRPSLCKSFRAWVYYKWSFKKKRKVGACSWYYVQDRGIRVLGVQYSWEY